jgi:hypothetical protein
MGVNNHMSVASSAICTPEAPEDIYTMPITPMTPMAPMRATTSKWKQAGSVLLLALWIPLLVGLFLVGKLLRVPGTDKLILTFHRGVARLFNLHAV